jgi:PAS domain S-box-containing protein
MTTWIWILPTLVGQSVLGLLTLMTYFSLRNRLIKHDLRVQSSVENAGNRDAALLICAEENARQLQGLCDSLPQIVWTSTVDGSIDYYNTKWFSYTGLSLDDSLGQGWEVIIHRDDLLKTMETWARSIELLLPYEMEHRLKRNSDGMFRWHVSRAVPVHDTQGHVVRWFGTSTDIHESRLASANLAAMAVSSGR